MPAVRRCENFKGSTFWNGAFWVSMMALLDFLDYSNLEYVACVVFPSKSHFFFELFFVFCKNHLFCIVQ